MPSSPVAKSPKSMKRSSQGIFKKNTKNTQQAPISLDQRLISAVTQKKHQEVFLCLEAGANPNTRNPTGLTVLMIAAYNRDLASLTYLVNHRANTNLGSPRGETALYLSALQGERAAANWLLRHKADPNIPTLEWKTPLGAAIYEHAHSRLPELYEQTVKTLLKGRANPNQPHLGYAPLWLAARQGSEALVLLLLRAGAVIHKATATLRSKDGSSATFTAIEAARECAHERIAQQLEQALIQQRTLISYNAPAKSSPSKLMKPGLSILNSNEADKPSRAKMMRTRTLSQTAPPVSVGMENIKW